jgi:hypothetical protein
MRSRQLAATLIAVAALLAPPAIAQNSSASSPIGFAAGGALTFGNLTGGDFSGTKGAAGFDLNAGATRGPWSLLLGYDRTNHGHEDTSGDFVVSNIYVEPRYAFARSNSRLTPYVTARLGRAMASFEEPGGFSEDAHGYIIGVGAGLLWPLTGPLNIDAAVHVARVSHDYGGYSGEGGSYSTAEKGNRINMRVGMRWAPARK